MNIYERHFPAISTSFLNPGGIQKLPKVGLVTLEDAESGEQILLNTYSKDVRQRFSNLMLAKRLERERIFKQMKIIPCTINTGKPYIQLLAGYFKKRIKIKQ